MSFDVRYGIVTGVSSTVSRGLILCGRTDIRRIDRRTRQNIDDKRAIRRTNYILLDHDFDHDRFIN